MSQEIKEYFSHTDCMPVLEISNEAITHLHVVCQLVLPTMDNAGQHFLLDQNVKTVMTVWLEAFH